MNTIDQQVSVIMNGAEFGDEELKAVMTEELRTKLLSAEKEGRPLEVYCGYDVTAPDIHLGHTITMRKLRQFQEFGHNVTFLIGTFTTLIGDPSDRDKSRSAALPDTVKQNAETYAEQAFKILDRNKTFVRYNHEWLRELDFTDIITMASHFTVQQLLNRDRLKKRFDAHDPLWLRELLYPLAQGYDAVALKSDVQIGATEQLYNLMAGRKLQEVYRLQPQVCITYPVLVGTDGTNRMSKSLGNYIGVNEPATIQYEKVMNLPDEVIFHYLRLVSRWTPERTDDLMRSVENSSVHPMAAKQQLAREIVGIFHGETEAEEAERHFETVHRQRRVPDDMPEYRMEEPENIIDLLVKTGLCSSRNDARRQISQKSIRLNDETVISQDSTVPSENAVLQKGRRYFVRLTSKK